MKRSPMPARRSPLLRGSGLSRTQPIPRISKRRQREGRAYSKLRVAFLAEFPRCVFPSGCTQASTEVHHRAGRVGALYLDVTRWSALCSAHHSWTTLHPAAAVEMGISELRIGGAA